MKAKKKEWLTTNIIAIAAIIMSTVISWHSISANYKNSLQTIQFNLSADERNNLIESIFALEEYLEELESKYEMSSSVELLLSELTPEDGLKLNSLTREFNKSLVKLQTLVSDQDFEKLKEDIPLGHYQNLSDLQIRVLSILRKMNYPDTIFGVEDVAFLNYVYEPIKEQ